MFKNKSGSEQVGGELRQMMRWGERQEILQLLVRMAKSGDVDAMRLFFELTGDLSSATPALATSRDNEATSRDKATSRDTGAARPDNGSRRASDNRDERIREFDTRSPAEGSFLAVETGGRRPARNAFQIRPRQGSIPGDTSEQPPGRWDLP